MHCNGKCHLKKELAKASEGNRSSSKKSTSLAEAEYLQVTATSLVVFNACKYYPALNFRYSNLYSGPSASSVFHPPLLLS